MAAMASASFLLPAEMSLASSSAPRYPQVAASSSHISVLCPRRAKMSICTPHFFVNFHKSHDVSARAWRSSKNKDPAPIDPKNTENSVDSVKNSTQEQAQEEEEVEISWIEEKRDELVQMTGTAIRSIPGPRVGESSVPWLLAVPVAYFGITFVIAVYRTIKKYNSPKSKKRRMIGKNAFLVTSLDKYFPSRRQEFDNKALQQLERKCNFNTKEVLRKYIRYVMNERPFTPEAVADLLHLRRVTKLTDEEVAEVLNETAKRIVKEKGTVMMDLQGLTERGVQRKVAVQALFSKLLYLSELEEFCSTSSLKLKEVFGVTDEDANSLRIETLSERPDIESLDKMVDSEEEENSEPKTP